MRKRWLLAAAVVLSIGIPLTGWAAAAPELTALSLKETAVYGGSELAGSLAAGYQMVLDGSATPNRYQLDVSSAATNVALHVGDYGFYLTGYPAGFFPFWAGNGVNSAAGGWQGYMWQIINGLQPMVYLSVTETPGGLQLFHLLDGLQKGFFATNQPLAVPGDYPPGVYTVEGRILNKTHDSSNVIRITFVLLRGDAESDVRDASGYLDITGTGIVSMTPGQQVVLMRFKVEDPGTADPSTLDVAPDGYNTYIESITVRNIAATPANVSRVELYRDNGNFVFDGGDSLIDWTNGFDGSWDAVFGALEVVPDNSIAWYFVVATLRPCCYNLNEGIRVQITNATVDPAPWNGNGDTAGSRIETSFPVTSPVTYRLGGIGDCDATLSDPSPSIGEVAIAPDTTIILQDVVVTDNGADIVGTHVRSITISEKSGTLGAGDLRDYKLYQDSNDNGAVDPSDPLLAWVMSGDLGAGVTFSHLPNALATVATGTSMRFLVTALVDEWVPFAGTVQCQMTVATGDDLRNPVSGAALGPSSWICTPMPFAERNPMIVGGTNLEIDVVDRTIAGGFPAGAQGAIVQIVMIEDAGSLGDTAPDGFPTRVDTITIGLSGPPQTLITKGCVSRLYVALDSDGVPGPSAGDLLLGEESPVTVASFPLTFGDTDELLFEVPSDDTRAIYVLADLQCVNCVCGDAIRTTFSAHTFSDGELRSSGFDPATPMPAVGAPRDLRKALPGGNEADIYSWAWWMDVYADPGAKDMLVLDVVINDPGSVFFGYGDLVDDGLPLNVDQVIVRLVEGTISPEDILAIRLYRETDGIPGLDIHGDTLVAGPVASPALDGRVTFSGNPILFTVAEEDVFYFTVDLARTGLENGDWGRFSAAFVPGCRGSGIENAYSDEWGGTFDGGAAWGYLLTIGQPPVGDAPIVIDDLTISPTGSGTLVVGLTVADVADFQVGPVGELFITESDQINVTGLSALAPYVLESWTADDPDTAGEPVTIHFVLHVNAGDAPAAGPVLNVAVQGTGTDGDTCDADIYYVDVFRDIVGADLGYWTDGGVISLSGQVTPPGLMGDVNDDGAIDVTDARLVAEYSIGLTPIGTFLPGRADVNYDGMIDVTDARWIAEAAIGMRPLPLATRVSGPASLTQASVSINEFGELIVAGTNADVTDLQGTLYFDPDDVTVTAVGGANGFVVLASAIDNDAGWVKFAAAKLSGGAVGGAPVVLFEAAGDVASAVLDVDVLRDKSGQSVPFKTQRSGVGLITEFGCFPNPVQDVHTTYFSAKGTQPIESIRVEIYDFSGALVYDSDWGPNDLAWHVQNDAGDVLANGVYYYRMQVLFVGSDVPVTTKIGKVAVYR